MNTRLSLSPLKDKILNGFGKLMRISLERWVKLIKSMICQIMQILKDLFSKENHWIHIESRVLDILLFQVLFGVNLLG
jgi:hypothetical protein